MRVDYPAVFWSLELFHVFWSIDLICGQVGTLQP